MAGGKFRADSLTVRMITLKTDIWSIKTTLAEVSGCSGGVEVDMLFSMDLFACQAN